MVLFPAVRARHNWTATRGGVMRRHPIRRRRVCTSTVMSFFVPATSRRTCGVVTTRAVGSMAVRSRRRCPRRAARGQQNQKRYSGASV